MESKRVKAAQRIADHHFDVESDMERIILLEPLGSDGDTEEPIKLLEIVKDSFADDVYPIGFPSNAARGVFYPTTIVEINPSLWPSIEAKGFVEFGTTRWTLGRELTPSVQPL